nr:transposase [Rhodovulum imhoffii]
MVIESWRHHYNTKRPHSSLGDRPPAPEVVQGPAPPSETLRRPPQP